MKVVFVCNQNQCRSPMAEGLARSIAAARGLSLEARSAGLSAFPGAAIHPLAAVAMERIGLDIRGHRARNLTRDDVAWADRIVLTDPRQTEFLRTWFPQAEPKIAILLGTGIPDPVTGGLEDFAACRDLLSERILAFLSDRVPEGVRLLALEAWNQSRSRSAYQELVKTVEIPWVLERPEDVERLFSGRGFSIAPGRKTVDRRLAAGVRLPLRRVLDVFPGLWRMEDRRVEILPCAAAFAQ